VQRPLWASTGVKNPQYPETLYVYGLVGPDTVNTMPLPTLMAARQTGEITGATAAEDPTADLDACARPGIDLDDVTDKLLRDAIDAFLVPMAKLLDGIERKREAIVTEPPGRDRGRPAAGARAAAGGARQRAHDEDVARRIWQRDGTLWAPEGTAEVTDRLGWLTIADKLLEEADALDAFREECVADGLTDVVLLGMGGSSLAPEVFRLSYGQRDGGLRLHVLDSTEPLQIEAVEREIDLAKTLFLVSTKSGGTIETISLFKHFHALQGDGSHYVLITDPGSSLLELAEENSFRRAFQNDPEIGGRYSALSYFGLVPAALAGIDIRPLLEGAQVAEQACSDFENPEDNAGLWLGPGARRARARRPRQADRSSVDDPIASFGVWVEQLVAESTGKQGRGILPVADEPLADPGAYGGDRVFLHLRNTDEPDAGHDEAIAALAKAGHPTITVQARGPDDLGRVFFLFEFAVAVVGWVLEINPVRPAQRAAGQGRHEEGARRGRAGRGHGRPRDALRRPRVAGLPGDHGLPAVLRRGRGGDRAAAREGHRVEGRRHHLRLRPALPALDRPVPQGRPRGRAVPPARARLGRRRRRPRRRVRLPDADLGAGRRRPPDPCATTAWKPCACA
jgi:glucose-6-phosphate isomerase